MDDIIRLVGPQGAVEILGIRMVGINAENGKKLLFSLVFILFILLLGRLLGLLADWFFRRRVNERARFWTRQGIRLAVSLLLFVGLVSVWFDDPMRLATALGLVTAGLAFALQRVVTAVAGYFVILRGKTFNVGDRIVMGGVRGDVIALRFTQTVIMEMGQPPPVQQDRPAMWVQARQYTGRIVTVSNARIFDEPVYNYTLEFNYLWEELMVPVRYGTNRIRAEEIMLESARRHTVTTSMMGEEAMHEMQRRYLLKPDEIGPRVYYRLTDNWLEMTVRFIVEDRGIRDVKDAMSRDILQAFEREGIEISSATVDVVGLPPLVLRQEKPGEPRPS